jgi:hypothetical protein
LGKGFYVWVILFLGYTGYFEKLGEEEEDACSADVSTEMDVFV